MNFLIREFSVYKTLRDTEYFNFALLRLRIHIEINELFRYNLVFYEIYIKFIIIIRF